jgi:large subunit ribosomal protein L45
LLPRKYIPGFDRHGFKSDALALYRDVCRQLAAGEKSALRQLVTPAVFSDMKRQLKQREDGGWARVHWELARVRGGCVYVCVWGGGAGRDTVS